MIRRNDAVAARVVSGILKGLGVCVKNLPIRQEGLRECARKRGRLTDGPTSEPRPALGLLVAESARTALAADTGISLEELIGAPQTGDPRIHLRPIQLDGMPAGGRADVLRAVAASGSTLFG